MAVRFSKQLVAEFIQPFWAAWQAGEFMTDASAVAGRATVNAVWLGCVRAVACVRAVGATYRGDTCLSANEKRSRWAVPAASRSAASPGVWDARPRR